MIARYSRLLSVLVIVAGVFLLYKVKYKVEALQHESAELAVRLGEEREALHVAAAEWAYLTRPQRLQALSDKYLALTPIAAVQIADVASIPLQEELRLTSAPAQEMVLTPVRLEP